MNKVVALSLVSVFLLSILVGYLPVLTTQAASSSPQTYIVQIYPPFIYAIVITGVNLGPYNALGEIAYNLNVTLNKTVISINVTNVQNGQNILLFSGTFSSSSKYVASGYDDALYSPAAQAVVIPVALNKTVYKLSVAELVAAVQAAIGVSLVNTTIGYLVNVSGGKVFTNQTTYTVSADGIFNSQGQSFYSVAMATTIPGTLNSVWDGLKDPTILQEKNLEVAVSMTPKVMTPSSLTPITAPTASQVLFAPISIKQIYNEMMNDQAVGWGRSLINITVYNPIQYATRFYVYELNYTGPGPIKVNFYPVFQIMSADQLYYLKPTVGLFTFNGTKALNKNAMLYNYTLIILSYNTPTIDVRPYYNGGKTTTANYIPIQGSLTTLSVTVNNQIITSASSTYNNIYAFAITFTNYLPAGQSVVYQETAPGPVPGTTVPVYVQFDGVYIPLYAVYVNSTASALSIEGLQWFYEVGTPLAHAVQPLPIPSFNLTMVYKLPLEQLAVTTQLSVTSYEAISAGSYNSLGNNEYGGTILTTPPTEGQVVGTFTLTGNATIGTTYTTVYITGFGVNKFEYLNTSGTTAAGQPFYSRIAVEGYVATPAYPILNGTIFTGLTLVAQTVNPNNGYVEVNVYDNSYPITSVNPVTQFVNGRQALVITINTPALVHPLSVNSFYGQYVALSSVPAVQIISPSVTTLSMTISPGEFYIALVDLGLWTNQTIVYVNGYVTTTIPGAGILEMYGISYFDAMIAPVSVMMSNVTPNDFVCNNAVWVAFKSYDDVEVTGTYYGQYGMVVTNLAAVGFHPVTGALLEPTAAVPINVNLNPTNDFNKAAYISVLLNQIAGPNQYLITNYPGISNYTEQTGVPGGLVITGVLPNSVPLNWSASTHNPAPGLTSVTIAPGVTRNYVYAVNLLPMPQPGTVLPTPVFNLTVYLRYQLYNAYPATTLANLKSLPPGFYYGANNSIIVITPPNLTVGSKVTISFVSGDYAVHYYFSSNENYWNKTVTIVVPNTTLVMKAPARVPLYDLTVPLQVIEPYYAAPYPAQLQIGTNALTLLANAYNFFGVTPKPYMVGVGKFMNVTVRFANGTTERIYLAGSNVTTLFQGGTLNENGSCTGAYNATISISGLMKILHLTSVSQLNGSCLTITYYDNITHEIATAKICFGGVSVVSPITITPAYIFYVLTAKYINATFGYPVTLAQSVAVQPFVSLNDTFLAKAQAGVVANLNVINVTIIDHYGNKYVIYYNSTSGSTNVMINGVVKYSYKGNLLPTIPETAPNTGIFNGSPITLVINMPGTIYKNGTVFNGTLAVKLGSNVATLGPATNFALPAFSFAGKLFGYNSTMYVKVEDPATGSTVTLKTYIAAYNITPIRIAPVTIPVPMPANASTKLQYVYNQPITLTPTNQYIIIHVTSIINYTYVFYIATVVQPGKNATTTPPVLVNFQTVVPVPVIGPGIVAQVPVQFSQIGALGSGYYTITMFAVPFAGGPVISLYPAKLVFTNVYVNATVV